RGPDALDVRIRDPDRGVQPGCGVRPAQLVPRLAPGAVRGRDVELRGREPADPAPRVALADQGSVAGRAQQLRERDPGQPAREPRRVDPGVARGEGGLVADVVRPLPYQVGPAA